MTKPIIGITTLNWPVPISGQVLKVQGMFESYIQAVDQAGGIPLMIPLTLSPDLSAGIFVLTGASTALIKSGMGVRPIFKTSPPDLGGE